MESRFPKIVQIAMLVRDLEKTVAHYENDFGIGPWEILEFGPKLFPKMLVNGEPGMVETRNAFCKCYGSFEIELIQPVSQSAYMNHMREHGPGLHHFAVLTNNSNQEFLI